VRQVLSFARGVEGERVALQPKHLIKEIVKILRETLPKSIEINFQIPQDLWIISADATQIHQVLMNLCVNARDAMPEGGSISIKAENVFVDENYARMHLEAKPGRFVTIYVSDTGPGMTAEVQSRIFEPFFTTKEMTKGTGLGLSTALTIVKSHGGFINVYSELHKGSQFTLYLPALDTPGAIDAAILQTDLPLGNGELVLVVDDEESIREITRGTLETFGYNVLTASDGTEALAFYADKKNEIDALAGTITRRIGIQGADALDTCLAGTPEQIREQLHRLEAAGGTTIFIPTLFRPLDELRRDLDQLIADIAPGFRR